jgi:nucleotide-binding universal stress UspA family protein
VIVRRGRPVRTAMLCTDGSDDAMAAADALAAMPWLPDVEVTVLAVEQQGFDADAATGRAAARLGRAAGVRERCIARSQAGALVNVRDCILALLGKTDPDLLVQGTAGLSTWGALRAGSIASSLAAHAPCSVLMARAPRT